MDQVKAGSWKFNAGLPMGGRDANVDKGNHLLPGHTLGLHWEPDLEPHPSLSAMGFECTNQALRDM